ncbi:MAG: alpha/beta fold hydrolase [Aureliella sp.]
MTNQLSITTSGGNMLCVHTAGDGPILMLVHGFPLDHTMWDAQIESLASSYRVLAPDMRGFGASTNYGDNYSIADLADDLEYARHHLANDQPIFLCGLSMGGYIALEYHKRHGKHLAGIILADTKPQSDDDATKAAREAMADRVGKVGSWEATRGMLPKLLSTRRATGKDTTTADVARMLRRAPASSVASAQRAMARRADFASQLSSISVPTLVVAGEDDVICPPDATRKWAADIPQASMEIINGAGHIPPMETPAAFNELLERFMGQLTSG